jgi:hypothetical protein
MGRGMEVDIEQRILGSADEGYLVLKQKGPEDFTAPRPLRVFGRLQFLPAKAYPGGVTVMRRPL